MTRENLKKTLLALNIDAPSVETLLGDIDDYCTKVSNGAKPIVSGSASDFERELYKLINEYVSAGLKKPDLVHKIEYVTQSCRVS